MIERRGKRIIGLVGKRGSGKTSLILDILRRLESKDLRIKGVISPGIFEGERKVAIELIDLASREGRLLARLAEEEQTGLQFGDWSFFESTLEWGNQKLKAIKVSDLLILDEIGPLELNFNQGLHEGLARMREGDFKLGIITLRPKCAKAIQRVFPEIELFFLDVIDNEALKETVFRIASVNE